MQHQNAVYFDKNLYENFVFAQPDSNEIFSCQVQLLNALQGAETDAVARNIVASTITELNAQQKADLVQFLKEVSN